MDTETATTPAADDVAHVDTEAEVANADTADQNDIAELELDDEGNPIAQDEDFDEVEYGEGKKFKLPRELNRGFLREADYTQKTQALAQERQALEAERSQHAEMTTALRSQIGKVHALEERAEKFKAVPWDQLRAEDPDTWRELRDDYAATRDDLAQAKQELEKGENDYRAKVAEDANKHLAAVDKALADPKTGIPGWGPQKVQELAAFAGTQGYTADDLRQASASDWKILNLAAEGAKALKAKSQVQRHTQAQTTTPAAPIKGAAPPRGLSDRMSTDEWMRQRNAQAAKAR